MMQDYPPEIVDVSKVLAAYSGDGVDIIALSALAIAGAALGNTVRGTHDGMTEYSGALQFGLLSPSPGMPKWLALLTAPLCESAATVRQLSEQSSSRELRANLAALKLKHAQLSKNPDITLSVRRHIIDDATIYALAASEQGLVVTRAHPWWADTAQTRGGAAPLWLAPPDALGQWAGLNSNERQYLYRALRGSPGCPFQLSDFILRCPVLAATNPEQLSYWLNVRGTGIPLIILPLDCPDRATEPLDGNAVLAWRSYLKLLLGLRAFRRPSLLTISIEGLMVLNEFVREAEAKKERLPRRLWPRLESFNDFAHRISFLLHCLNGRKDEVVSEQTALAAIRIGSRLLDQHVELVREVASQKLSLPALPAIERPPASEVLFEKILRSQVPLTRRQLCRKFNTMNVAELEALLRELDRKKLLIYR